MCPNSCFPLRLAVVSHVRHYRRNGQIFAYEPYTREIEIWADLFREINILAPCPDENPPADCAAFERSNISIVPQRELFAGPGLREWADLTCHLPGLVLSLSKGMRNAQAIHVRCPGNFGLLGAILAPLFSPYLIAKYAGQWTGFPGEAFETSLQRWILRSRWWKGPVTVYGSWSNQPTHVIPFFTSIFVSDQILRARAAAEKPRTPGLLRILFTGRLTKSKNVDVLLEASARIKDARLPFRCLIAGEGPERRNLERLRDRLKLSPAEVKFVGAVPFDTVLTFLEQSDVLVLVSQTEGWPKSLVEGMAFGLICIGSNVGCVAQLLSEGRGMTVPPRDVEALVGALSLAAESVSELEPMRRRTAEWAQQFSLETLRHRLRELISEQWNVSTS